MAGPPAKGKEARRRRAPSSADLDLWRRAMRDVAPLAERPPQPLDAAAEPAELEPPPRSKIPSKAPRSRNAAIAAPSDLAPIEGPRAPGLDRSSAERLKRGRYPIEARLDLHGLTQDEAHRALISFVAGAAARSLRCILIITGKGLRRLAAAEEEGRGGDLGILRNAVPRWLNEAPTRAHILAFATAQPRDGGSGALYVLLRRQR